MPHATHVERHFTGTEIVRDIVIGTSDGLTVPFALATGLSGAITSTRIIVTAGLAEIAAGSNATGLGGYLAARSDAEHYDCERRREQREVVEKREAEKHEVMEVLETYGLTPEESRMAQLLDCGGRIVLLNTQVERLSGYSRDKLLGQPIEILMQERFRSAHTGHRVGYGAHPHTRPMGAGLALLGRRRDGNEFPAEISMSPMQTSEGRLVVGMIRDVTLWKQAEEERSQLLAREREKSEQLKLSIREAHHRIKNNLQAVSDLLYLELTQGEGAHPRRRSRKHRSDAGDCHRSRSPLSG
jgi:PAS domain S-box-containing protein